MADFVVSRETILAEIHKLPQAPYLDDDRINIWIDRVMEVDPHRVLWHVARLRGFGGSEIGTIAADEDTPANIFRSSPRQMVAAKLMLEYPEPSTGHTRRGTEMEPRIRQEFHLWCGGTPMTEELDRIAKFVSKDHPWLVGNPDDLMLIDGKAYLVDYKCPSGDVTADLNKNGLPFDYVAQLHHYRLICEACGIEIAGMMLCSWDCGAWTIDVRPVEYDPDLAQRIIDQGDFYWFNHLLVNQLPSWELRRRNEVMSDPELVADMNMLLTLNTLSNLASTRADAIKEARVQDFRNAGLAADAKVSAGFIDISFKPKLNEEAVIARIEKLGKNPEDFLGLPKVDAEALVAELRANGQDLSKYEGKREPDVNLMLEFLAAQGEMPEAFQEDAVVFRTAGARSGPVFETLTGIKQDAEAALTQLVEQMVLTVPPRPEVAAKSKPKMGM